jgi:hypothetical protein
MLDEQAKANEAFYKWEADNNEQNLSDRDRMIWTAGWIQANERPTIILLGEALNNLMQSADAYVDHGDSVVENIQVLEHLRIDIEWSKTLLKDLQLGAYLPEGG